MKRVAVVILSVLLVLFAAVTILKISSSRNESTSNDSDKTSAEKEKIRKFWQTYRQATQFRLAGEAEKAAATYRQALAFNDRHEDALYYLGNIYLDLGEFARAEQAWKRLVQINSRSSRAHFQLGRLYLCVEQPEFFNLDAAEREFRRALEINKEETGPTLRLGQVALLRGNLPLARRYFEAVTRSNHMSVEAHFLASYLAWKDGDVQRASAFLARAKEHAGPLKPVEGASGEGDTKTGKALSTSTRSNCRDLFLPYVENLSEGDGANLSSQAESRYRELDSFLNEIRGKIRSY